MPSNYEKIREDNIRRRGEEFDDIGRFISEMLYSDKTHFVYELLQNVEDALERRDRVKSERNLSNDVTFRLYHDRLEISHYGIPFSEGDVNGISDVVAGTKAEDFKQIGKFGIGFKSVYAFTASPEIHSGDEHFNITRYIRPHAVTKVDLQDGETLIILPFDHEKVEPEKAYDQIFQRLSNLGLKTLLFLKNIETIHWEVNGERKGTYLKDTKYLESDMMRLVSLIGESNGKTVEERWLIFSREVSHKYDSTQSEVEAAFSLDSNSDNLDIKTIHTSPLHAYFPTSIETNLHFLIQGHYNTTPGRDNIRIDDEWNLYLINQTADLVVDSLFILKKKALVDVELIKTMPIERDFFPKDNIFFPIFNRVLEAFQNDAILPTDEGQYIKADKAKLARGQALKQLLGDQELRDLFDGRHTAWLTSDITSDRTPAIRSYLLYELNVDEIDPERFGRLLDEHFLNKRTDEWMINFYSFLNEQLALWNSKTKWNTKEGVLRNKPIIRKENLEHCIPFDEQRNPKVYLPPEGDTDFPIVRRRIAKNKDAYRFFSNLGLKVPDLVDEVVKNIIPKYLDMNLALITEEENFSDVKKIVDAFRTVSKEKREKLKGYIRNVPFLMGVNQKTKEKEYQCVNRLYIMDKGIGEYFRGNPNAWDLDYKYYPHKETLIKLGVRDEVAVLYNKPDQDQNVIIKSSHGHHVRGLDKFDPNCVIDGLEYALQNPTIERSKYIWNELLSPIPHLIKGTVERCSRRNYDKDVISEVKYSTAGRLLLEHAWIPAKDGAFYKPDEMSINDLLEGFEKNQYFASQLNMRMLNIKIVAEDLGVDEGILDLFIKAYSDDRSALEDFLSKRLKDQYQEEVEGFHYADELENVFDKPGVTGQKGVEKIDRPIPDPERRRSKTRGEIERDLDDEPERGSRYRRVPKRIWENKDSGVKTFLKEQYGGKCQICDDTFTKRNGEPYFEGLYLIPHSQSRWVDRPGNVLCLCATCCAKLMHGQVENEGIINQIKEYKPIQEGGSGSPSLDIMLCGEPVKIRYTERHMLDLQELVLMEYD